MSLPSDASEADPRSGMRLLLVDSDAAARAELNEGLKRRFEIIEAETCSEALAQLATRWFNVIIADYALQDHDGIWLLERIAESYPHMYRILISEHSVPNVRGLRDAGVFQLFMGKPVQPEALSAYFVPTT
jgi:DNA-binding NtrC family response regulator